MLVCLPTMFQVYADVGGNGYSQGKYLYLLSAPDAGCANVCLQMHCEKEYTTPPGTVVFNNGRYLIYEIDGEGHPV